MGRVEQQTKAIGPSLVPRSTWEWEYLGSGVPSPYSLYFDLIFITHAFMDEWAVRTAEHTEEANTVAK